MPTKLDFLESTIIACDHCPRLVAWREQVAGQKRRAFLDWDYWGKPVPGFGDPAARVLVVGLAPGAHGSNRTGRMFTGDSSGDFLYRALHKAGFASQPVAVRREDGLTLHDLFISAVCRCAPPGNKPTSTEIDTCIPYLEQEIALLANIQVVVALGKIAFDNVLKLYARLDQKRGTTQRSSFGNYRLLEFSHGATASLGPNVPWLVSSYHPSRQNTQTGRLTVTMFDEVWAKVKALL